MGEREQTYLVLPHTDVIPVVHARVDAQRPHSPQDDLSSRVSVEGASRQVYREVRVAQVLSFLLLSSPLVDMHAQMESATYMVDRASPAMSPDERDPSPPRRTDVDLLPRVLVAADDDARVVAVQQQQRLLRRLVPEQPVSISPPPLACACAPWSPEECAPVLKRKVEVGVRGARYVYRMFRRM